MRNKLLVKKLLIILTVALMLFLVSCANVQEKWNTLTPDEQARIVVDGIRVQLDTTFSQGKDYIAANPQYKDVWVKSILPGFETAYAVLYNTALLASSGNISPAEVYARVQPSVDSVIGLLVQIGMLKGGIK